MSKRKLTEEFIANAPAPSMSWDSEVSGFGLEVHPTGSKRYVCQCDLRSGGVDESQGEGPAVVGTAGRGVVGGRDEAGIRLDLGEGAGPVGEVDLAHVRVTRWLFGEVVRHVGRPSVARDGGRGRALRCRSSAA